VTEEHFSSRKSSIERTCEGISPAVYQQTKKKKKQKKKKNTQKQEKGGQDICVRGGNWGDITTLASVIETVWGNDGKGFQMGRKGDGKEEGALTFFTVCGQGGEWPKRKKLKACGTQ